MVKITRFLHPPITAAAAAVPLLFWSSTAMAQQTIGGLAGHWAQQGAPLVGAIVVFCYALAFFAAMIGGWTLYKSKNNPQEDPQAGKKILAAFAGAIVLAAIPELLGVGVMSVFGSTDNLTSATPRVPQIGR